MPCGAGRPASRYELTLGNATLSLRWQTRNIFSIGPAHAFVSGKALAAGEFDGQTPAASASRLTRTLLTLSVATGDEHPRVRNHMKFRLSNFYTQCSLSVVVAIMATTSCAEDADSAHTDFFENNIRPLLISHCVKCHGPKKAESGLRLDNFESVIAGGDSGPALVPGKPEESLVVQAVLHNDGLEMPPDEKLDAPSIAALQKWVQQGAVWPDGMHLAGTAGPQLRSGPITDEERNFWSFRPITIPRAPEIAGTTDIDRFINAGLAEAGLQSQPPASKRTLIRRATFDLTGLPPTAEEINAFLADESDDAFRTVVDRLLNSRAYGERWGRHWMDVVRYADTAGETADYPTPLSWKYRNWVIDAFNKDKPYDDFIREQIAGDILAGQLPDDPAQLAPSDLKRYRELLTATGFVAISRRFGFDVENYHHLTIQDTIDTVGQAVLGLSLGCARCHDHKYDPVSTEDYYAWYGIFESTQYSFPGSEEKKRPYDLIAELPPSIASKRMAQHESRIAELNEQIADLTGQQKDLKDQMAVATGTVGFSGFETQTTGERPDASFGLFGTVVVKSAAQSPFRNVFSSGTRGLAAPADLSNNAFVRTIEPAHDAQTTPRLYYNIDFRNVEQNSAATGAYRFYLGQGPGHSAAVEMGVSATTFFIRNGSTYHAVRELQPGEWYNVQVELDLVNGTWSGHVGVPGDLETFTDVAVSDGWSGVVDHTFVDRYGPGSGRVPAWHVDNLAVSSRPFSSFEMDRGNLLQTPFDNGQPTSDSRDVSDAVDIAAITTSLRKLTRESSQLVSQRDQLVKDGPYPKVYGAVEGDKPSDSRVQLRGEKTKLGDVATRSNLEILGGDMLPEQAGSGRWELAEWLTRDSNPLTARVMVNRIWQGHFGRGLVATANDFGARGEQPSHPELLDWLASRFRDSGWSVKSMHRLIMLSDAYQRSSSYEPVAAEADPEARLIWRFNRRRLCAEEIRDAMLFVSGDLDPTPGEQHPFPAEETWGFTQHSPFYAVYPSQKRSIYLMQQRLKRHPFLSLFDGADPNASTARRDLTTVPTQALFLMNNEFVHQCADRLAAQVIVPDRSPTERVHAAFLMVLGRPATAEECDRTIRFLKRYSAAVPSTNPDHEQLAFRSFARTLLTQNEFLFVD